MKKKICKELRAAVSHLPKMEYSAFRVESQIDNEIGLAILGFFQRIPITRPANVYRRMKRAYKRGEQHSMMQYLDNVADGSHKSKKLAVTI